MTGYAVGMFGLFVRFVKYLSIRQTKLLRIVDLTTHIFYLRSLFINTHSFYGIAVYIFHTVGCSLRV